VSTHPDNSLIPPVFLASYGEDVVASLAELIIRHNTSSLPDLSQAIVLLPDLQAAPRLRRLLLGLAAEHGVSALIGPQIHTLSGWLSQFGNIPAQPQLAPEQRELMLTEILMEHPQLYGKGSPWTLARSLGELFDELTLHQARLPADYTEFIQILSKAYDARSLVSGALGREASLVHTLWHAWHQQLQMEGVIESSTAHLLKLATCSASLTTNTRLYLAGFHHFSRTELGWLKQLLENRQACVIIEGSNATATNGWKYHPDAVPGGLLELLGQTPHSIDIKTKNPVTEFLDAAYSQQGPPLRERAKLFATHLPQSPVAERMFLYEAANADEEARAVDIQVRRWLLEGHQQIGIVTENRRLARQVRALLEQGGVSIADSAGWALSTTSAAASLERWLQTVEEEFDQQPLLDLLKSPFIFAGQDREQLKTATYRFERDIVRNGNIARGIQRYRLHLENRQQQLPSWTEQTAREIRQLLNQLELAAKPLCEHLQGEHNPKQFIKALQLSMEKLGMQQALAEDDAGSCILRQIDQLSGAAENSRLKMSWREFRSWLGDALERCHFCPPASGSRVQLMNLAQSSLASFDALVIAAVEREYLPGTEAPSPFFNDAVRLELGLPASREHLVERFYLFRRLLQAAPQVLLTLRKEQDGEEIIPSPWLENLRAFHYLTYSLHLSDNGLPALIHNPRAIVFRCDTTALPEPCKKPAPAAPPGLLPRTISASSYQQLMNCPYQFFAARCLGLAPPEAIREALAKSDYGERIHRSLEAFHGDIPNLPGPFQAPFEEHCREQAILLLEQISDQVFADDLEDNFMHRGWLQQWKNIIPDYIDWQIRRNGEYRLKTVEIRCEVDNFTPSAKLRGRIDRMDENNEGIAIVDYKTGPVANREEILSGESVQLPFYALLTNKEINRCEYLQLDNKGVKSCSVLEGEELQYITNGISKRLKNLLEAIHNRANLPAWGDERTCGHCSLSGVCRRQSWPE